MGLSPRTAAIAVLALAAIAPAVATATPTPAQHVVVSATLGANDPVAGATVVARDARTGRVASTTATTGVVGYARILLSPGDSAGRVVITATGGSARTGSLTAGGQALRVTIERGDVDPGLDFMVNPATTIQSAYLASRPAASLEESAAVVGKAVRLPAGMGLGEAGRYSRRAFSGEVFATVARGHGGINAYATQIARRIATGGAVRSFGHPRTTYAARRSVPPATRAGARETAFDKMDVLGFVGGAMVRGLIEKGMDKAYCAMHIVEMCPPGDETATKLSEIKTELKAVEAGISDLKTQMATAQSSLASLNVAIAELGSQVAGIQYSAEGTAVDDVIRRIQVIAGQGAQGTDPTAAQVSLLKNAFTKLYALNSGCPNTAALVGALPRSVVAAAGTKYRSAGCISTASGEAVHLGLMQFAQRKVAGTLGAVAAGARQDTVDSAGEYWLNEFARDVFASSEAAMYAAQTGTGSRSPEDIDVTRGMFGDAFETMNADGTATYFGARIPTTQVLQVQGTEGTVYGIGTYADPGNCRGNMIGTAYYGRGNYTFTQDFAGGDAPVCTNFLTPPPVATGAPASSPWVPLGAWPTGVLERVKGPLRNAALCQVAAQARWTALPSGGGPNLPCRTFPEPVPMMLKGDFELPNLQVSTQHDKCTPWRIGTYGADPFSDWPTGRMSIAEKREFPGKAVGIECPVTDLTPGAAQPDGWNCVAANPNGTVMIGNGGTFTNRSVTSSSAYLNTRSMGGYCPNWGSQAGTPPRSNTDYLAVAGAKVCSRGFNVATGGAYGCADSSTANAWPLARQITALTTYDCIMSCIDWNTVPGYKAQNWTANDRVAGDYVVGPMYTSNAVGSYVPGTSPGGPIAGDGTRFATSAPGPARDVAVCGASCTEADGTVEVTWRAPESNGGFAITSYRVQASWTVPRTQGFVRTFDQRSSDACVVPVRRTTCMLRGIPTDGTMVQVNVAAVNRLGRGTESGVGFTENFNAAFAPGRPRVFTGSGVFQGDARITWAPPRKIDPLLGADRVSEYVVTARPGGATCRTVAPPNASQLGECVLRGLTRGTSYTVSVVGTIPYKFAYRYDSEEFTPASLPSLPFTLDP